MKIKRIDLKNVKSFSGAKFVHLEDNESVFTFSGTNGAGKSTLLKAVWLVQKLYFFEKGMDSDSQQSISEEVNRYLTSSDSYIKLTMLHEDKELIVQLAKEKNSSKGYVINSFPEEDVAAMWDLDNPKGLILYIDASKGFSEETLKFDGISIDRNERSLLELEVIAHPGRIFAGIYQQLVKDYVHARLIPSKPDRLLYFQVASKIFSSLMPAVEIKNFSGQNKPREFVLLGKSNKDKATPLYDVREFSSGEKALLSTLIFLCLSKRVSTLIIDEPENHFHESLLLEFMSTLHKLCEKGGIYSWLKGAEHVGKKINLEWVEKEYGEHNVNQVLISTHSKPLIYKTFSLGQNFIINNDISPIPYEDVEEELRKIGLSTTYSKVILVEGQGDNEALEDLFKGENIKIQPLTGSKAVVESFKNLSKVRLHLNEAKFVFLVDSDNKPNDFFEDLKAIDSYFYDNCFEVIDGHELENLMLDPVLIKKVLDSFGGISSTNHNFESATIEGVLINLAKESLPQVYKKQLSLSFQQIIEKHYARGFWGDSGFNWNEISLVKDQIESVMSDSSSLELVNDLKIAADDVFNQYSEQDDPSILKLCDGKQVLGKASGFFANKVGVVPKIFKKAVFKAAAEDPTSEIAKLAKRIRSKLS